MISISNFCMQDHKTVAVILSAITVLNTVLGLVVASVHNVLHYGARGDGLTDDTQVNIMLNPFSFCMKISIIYVLYI